MKQPLGRCHSGEPGTREGFLKRPIQFNKLIGGPYTGASQSARDLRSHLPGSFPPILSCKWIREGRARFSLSAHSVVFNIYFKPFSSSQTLTTPRQSHQQTLLPTAQKKNRSLQTGTTSTSCHQTCVSSCRGPALLLPSQGHGKGDL